MRDGRHTVPWATMGRVIVPLVIMGGCLWALAGLVDQGLLGSLPQTLAALPVALIICSALYAALSFWAVARYDNLAHRHFETEVSNARARRSGFAAITIGQTVGFGMLTGAAVRWRMLPELGLTGALKLSAFVSITFILAFAFVTAVVCLILPTPAWVNTPAALLAFGMPLVAVYLSFAPFCVPLRHRITLPSLRSASALLGWTAVDVLAAAFALFLLLPAGGVDFAAFLPVFLLAMGAAMLSGAPGGVGPFELTLVALLPSVPPVDLVAAIIAFRAIYYAVPALVGAAVVLLSKRVDKAAPRSVAPPFRDSPAELGILAQNGGKVTAFSDCAFALWRTTQTATMLFDPLSGTQSKAIGVLQAQGAQLGRIPLIYKCGPRTAFAAQKAGWSVARIAQDCFIDPRTYDLDVPARRGLRRKLRQAEKAGVQITRALSLPLWDMAQIDDAWQSQNGRARGGTMGRFCPDHIAGQDVFLAHQNGRLVAFASFHTRPTSRCLDLMRHGPDVASGTMHLMVHTALTYAKAQELESVSLAALPDFSEWPIPSGAWATLFQNKGLAQFKASFAPHQVARYAAAPTRLGLAIALADIAVEVHQPPPLASANQAHNQDDDYELDLDLHSWDPVPLTAKANP